MCHAVIINQYSCVTNKLAKDELEINEIRGGNEHKKEKRKAELDKQKREAELELKEREAKLEKEKAQQDIEAKSRISWHNFKFKWK